MPSPDVYLNIYKIDGSPDCCAPCGLYHTSVQIGELEYSFGERFGVTCSEYNPRIDGVHSFLQGSYEYSLYMGSCSLSVSELYGVVVAFRKAFPPSSYDIINNNCNHFSDKLLKAVVGKGIPPHINRASRYAQWLSCLLPSSCGYTPEGSSAGAGSPSCTYTPGGAPQPGAPRSGPFHLFCETGHRLGSLQQESAIETIKRFVSMVDCFNTETQHTEPEEHVNHSRSSTREFLAAAAEDRLRRQASQRNSSSSS